MAGKVRKNASATGMVAYFKEAVEAQGGKYYPVPYADVKHFKEALELYEAEELADAIDIYVKRPGSKNKIIDFIYRIPEIMAWMDKDQYSKNEQRRLMEETRDRMKGAGLL